MTVRLLTVKLFSESTHQSVVSRGFRPNQRSEPNNFGIMVEGLCGVGISSGALNSSLKVCGH